MRCELCGKPITGTAYRAGVVEEADGIMSMFTKGKWVIKPLCSGCATDARKAIEGLQK